jgi:hypothetical protein
MTMPGFAAEASVYRARAHYTASVVSRGAEGVRLAVHAHARPYRDDRGVVPQFCWLDPELGHCCWDEVGGQSWCHKGGWYEF